MVTIVGASGAGAQATIICLSTDTKPTDVPNGSICLEMDTSKVYLFDETNTQWREW